MSAWISDYGVSSFIKEVFPGGRPKERGINEGPAAMVDTRVQAPSLRGVKLGKEQYVNIKDVTTHMYKVAALIGNQDVSRFLVAIADDLLEAKVQNLRTTIFKAQDDVR